MKNLFGLEMLEFFRKRPRGTTPALIVLRSTVTAPERLQFSVYLSLRPVGQERAHSPKTRTTALYPPPHWAWHCLIAYGYSQDRCGKAASPSCLHRNSDSKVRLSRVRTVHIVRSHPADIGVRSGVFCHSALQALSTTYIRRPGIIKYHTEASIDAFRVPCHV